jgi:S1-C subfamily serine protease
VDYPTALRPSDYQQQFRQGRVDRKGCVVISEVEEHSPAWQGGLRRNMFISHVEKRRVTTPQGFRQTVAGKRGPVRVRLTLPSEQQPVRTIEPEA